MVFNKLSPEKKQVIKSKATEKPFSGEYDNFYKEGTYICRRCNNPLFDSRAKFDAECGWPAFDENFPNAVKRLTDEDGISTEIECGNCNAHLGHVFKGEKMTRKNCHQCFTLLENALTATQIRNKINYVAF